MKPYVAVLVAHLTEWTAMGDAVNDAGGASLTNGSGCIPMRLSKEAREAELASKIQGCYALLATILRKAGDSERRYHD